MLTWVDHQSTDISKDHTLIQQQTVLQMSSPDPIDLNDIQCFIASDVMGLEPFLGPDKNTWGTYEDKNSFSKELVCLRGRDPTDSFSRWVGERATRYLLMCGGARWKKPSSVFKTVVIRKGSILRVTFGITSVLASLIPITSIIVLKLCVSSIRDRLATIAGFNLLISVCLTVFTDARRTDVFAITAAYVTPFNLELEN